MMGYQLVDIYDNVVEDHVAELIHTQIKDCAWKLFLINLIVELV